MGFPDSFKLSSGKKPIVETIILTPANDICAHTVASPLTADHVDGQHTTQAPCEDHIVEPVAEVSQYHALGNAITPPVVQAIAHEILLALESSVIQV